MDLRSASIWRFQKAAYTANVWENVGFCQKVTCLKTGATLNKKQKRLPRACSAVNSVWGLQINEKMHQRHARCYVRGPQLYLYIPY